MFEEIKMKCTIGAEGGVYKIVPQSYVQYVVRV